MDSKSVRKRGPEAILQDAIIAKLRRLGWIVKVMHGNLFQFGVPDLYAAHRSYGARWIEIKCPTRTGDVFTPAQREFFHQLTSVNVGIWVLTGDSDEQIALLHKHPNWYQFLEVMRKA